MSRPKKKVVRTETVRFKLTKDEKEKILEEAKSRGLCLSEFIRVALVNELDMTDLNTEYYDVY